MNGIGVIIPFYNGGLFIRKCVGSILKNGVQPDWIYLVDNSPQAGGLEDLIAHYPQIRIIRTAPSLGFGRACNIGADRAMRDGASVLLVTNQDTILDEGCIAKLEQVFRENPAAAIVAPLNYTYGFESIDSSYVRYYLSQCPGLIADALAGQTQSDYTVQSAVGSCFMIRASVVRELGLFDELYFMYSEDDDLCRRYYAAGARISVAPRARVAHANSLTGSKNEEKIQTWIRCSRRWFMLKDLSRPLPGLILRSVWLATLDYARSVAKGRLLETAHLTATDVRQLLKIPFFLKSRRSERETISGYRAKREMTSNQEAPLAIMSNECGKL